MAWVLTILIAFWGLPLLTMLAIGLACLVSERLRLSAARILGLPARPGAPPHAGNNPAPAPARIARGGKRPDGLAPMSRNR